MKFILALLAFATSCLAAEADIYIVAGQSNGWRLSSTSSVPGKAKHLIYYFPMGCTTRPDKSEAKIIECVNPKTMGSGIVTALRDRSGKDIVFIQYCVCGSSLGDVANWYPGDDPTTGKVNNAGLYGSFTRYLTDVRRQVEALGIEWKVKALFWHQGESDVSRTPEVHEKNLCNLFIRFRQDLGADLPIVAAHIRELDVRSRGINRALDAVDAIDALMIAVKADDLIYESPTNVHIKTEGCITLGKRMVEALNQVVETKKP